jgi:uncharacterized protein involved in exopolysaccharide biosynthesis
LAVGAVVAHWLLATPIYTARATIRPEATASLIGSSTLGGLAARFGFGTSLGEVPLAFYGELLRSESLLASLVRRPYPSSSGDSVTLIEIYARPEDDEPHRLVTALERTVDHTTISLNGEANTVAIEFRATDPQLAGAVANAYLDLINEFNVAHQQTQARNLRRVLEETAIPAAARELALTEDTLADFYQRNRVISGSPTLLLEEARLQRRITLKQQSYLELATQLEQARVDEVRSIPAVTLVSPATPPVVPTSPRLTINLALGLLVAFVIWATAVLIELYGRALRTTQPEGVALFEAEAQAATRRLRGIVKSLRSRDPD